MADTIKVPLNLDHLMRTRGILYKMLLDSSKYRTPDEIEHLSEFLEWLHAFTDAAVDGNDEVMVCITPE